MKCAATQELISDYLDGALSRGVEKELQAHLEGCRDCRELARDLASIIRGARSLASLEPSAAVWPKIAAEVRETRPAEPEEVRARRSWLGTFWKPARWAMAAAGVLVLAVGGGLILRQKPWSSPSAAKKGSVEFTLAKLQEAQGYYEKAIQALSEAAESREGRMDPRLSEVFSRNLAAMDETIQSCRQIIQEDPDNLTARAYLLTAYREKVNFLEEIMEAGRPGAGDKSETTL
jgi:tetratricopeptide (TPR) repeat protein